MTNILGKLSMTNILRKVGGQSRITFAVVIFARFMENALSLKSFDPEKTEAVVHRCFSK